jgi:hypothetical protein
VPCAAAKRCVVGDESVTKLRALVVGLRDVAGFTHVWSLKGNVGSFFVSLSMHPRAYQPTDTESDQHDPARLFFSTNFIGVQSRNLLCDVGREAGDEDDIMAMLNMLPHLNLNLNLNFKYFTNFGAQIYSSPTFSLV